MEKNYDLAIDPDTQQSEEIRKLTAGQAEIRLLDVIRLWLYQKSL